MEHFVPQNVIIGVGIAILFFAVFTVTANGLLLFVIYKDPCKCLRRPSTGFVVALSATNLITGLVTDIACAVAVLEGFSDGSVNLQLGKPCTLSGFTTYTSEILLVVALALERVLANGFVAFHRNYLRFQTTLFASCFIWLYSLCFALLQVFKINEDLYHLVDIYLHHATPIVAITLANSVLYFLIRRHHRAIIPARLNTAHIQQMTIDSFMIREALQVRRERQLAIVVMIIGLLLFIFLMPYFVVILLSTSCSSCDQNVLYIALVICLPILVLNPVVNPYLYAWRLPQYKRSFKAVLRLNIL